MPTVPEVRAPDFGHFADAFGAGVRNNNALAQAARANEETEFRRERRNSNALAEAARAEAGRLYASGDSPGAERHLAISGNIDGAISLRNDRIAQQERAATDEKAQADMFAGRLSTTQTPEQFDRVVGAFAQRDGKTLDEYRAQGFVWENKDRAINSLFSFSEQQKHAKDRGGMTPFQRESLDLRRDEIGRKRSEKQGASANRRDILASEMQRLKQTALDMKSDPGLSRATGEFALGGFGTGLAASDVYTRPGSEPANFEAKFENLKSQVGFNVLQAMRNASQTGGALGQVAVQELIMLQNNLAALDPKQSPEQFQNQLQKIADHADSVVGRLNEAAQVDGEGDDRASAPQQQQQQQQQVETQARAQNPVEDARRAIAQGAPRDAVVQRLRENGIDPTEAGL